MVQPPGGEEGGRWLGGMGVVKLSGLHLQADPRQEDQQHQLAVCGRREDAVQRLRDRDADPGGGGVYPSPLRSFCFLFFVLCDIVS